jgi:hypothetical protein
MATMACVFLLLQRTALAVASLELKIHYVIVIIATLQIAILPEYAEFSQVGIASGMEL